MYIYVCLSFYILNIPDGYIHNSPIFFLYITRNALTLNTRWFVIMKSNDLVTNNNKTTQPYNATAYR